MKAASFRRLPVERFQAVLWDVDGTLVDSEPVHERAIVDVLRGNGIEMSASVRRKILGTSIAETHSILAASYPKIPGFGSFAAAKTAAYLARASEIRLRAGVSESLSLLESPSIRCAFVSNSGRTVLDAKLCAAAILREGLVSISRDDVRHGKPHPEPYLRASALLGVRPERCIVTEDSPLGAAAGLAAGMTVIGWPQSRSDGEDFPSGTILSAPLHLDEVLCLAFRTK